jgi:hypothetical protein
LCINKKLPVDIVVPLLMVVVDAIDDGVFGDDVLVGVVDDGLKVVVDGWFIMPNVLEMAV